MSQTKEQELSVQLGASSELWIHFYQLGCLFARSQNLVSGLTYLIDTFLIRGGEVGKADDDWIDFFRRQFTIYLLGKQHINCSLCEGDMIHDFLKDEYARVQEELAASELPFAEEHKCRWYASLELDFPWSIPRESSQ